MTRRARAARGAGIVRRSVPLAVAVSVGLLAGCPREAPKTSDREASASPRESNAGEDLIARAGSEEEKQALRSARAEEDERGRQAVAARDAEIERLRRENAELERQLGSR